MRTAVGQCGARLVDLPRHEEHHLVPFTPTSASWVNQSERWIVTLTQRQIRRGTHRAPRELMQAIRDSLSKNSGPKPFVWTKSPDDILASIKRFFCEIRAYYVRLTLNKRKTPCLLRQF
jgi:hypothetical protein